MYFIYVDDSGTPDLSDHSQYYVITGVIIHETNLRSVEAQVQAYKAHYFTDDYRDDEIHVHSIYQSKGNFKNLTLPQKYSLLDKLYDMIKALPITVIAVGIDKKALNMRLPGWNPNNAAWTFITERFEMFLQDNGFDQGLFRIDETSNICKNDVRKVIHNLRKNGSTFMNIQRIVEEPLFFDSKVREGLQLADATSYCTLRNLGKYDKFKPYWNIVYSKLRANAQGRVAGYGLKMFP